MNATLRATFLLVTLSLPCTLQAQSLADVAKKAEQERAAKGNQAADKGNTPTPKVYTNKDLDKRPSSSEGASAPEISPVETPAQPETPAAAETTAKAGTPVKKDVSAKTETPAESGMAARDARLDAEVARLKGLAALKQLQDDYHEFQRFVEGEASGLKAYNCGTVDQRLSQGDTCYERAAKLKVTYPEQLRRMRKTIWDLAVKLKLNPEEAVR